MLASVSFSEFSLAANFSLSVKKFSENEARLTAKASSPPLALMMLSTASPARSAKPLTEAPSCVSVACVWVMLSTVAASCSSVGALPRLSSIWVAHSGRPMPSMARRTSWLMAARYSALPAEPSLKVRKDWPPACQSVMTPCRFLMNRLPQAPSLDESSAKLAAAW